MKRYIHSSMDTVDKVIDSLRVDKWEYARVLGDKWYFAKVRRSDDSETYNAVIGNGFWEHVPADHVRFDNISDVAKRSIDREMNELFGLDEEEQ